jgi:hypothetical protein
LKQEAAGKELCQLRAETDILACQLEKALHESKSGQAALCITKQARKSEIRSLQQQHDTEIAQVEATAVAQREKLEAAQRQLASTAAREHELLQKLQEVAERQPGGQSLNWKRPSGSFQQQRPETQAKAMVVACSAKEENFELSCGSATVAPTQVQFMASDRATEVALLQPYGLPDLAPPRLLASPLQVDKENVESLNSPSRDREPSSPEEAGRSPTKSSPRKSLPRRLWGGSPALAPSPAKSPARQSPSMQVSPSLQAGSSVVTTSYDVETIFDVEDDQTACVSPGMQEGPQGEEQVPLSEAVHAMHQALARVLRGGPVQPLQLPNMGSPMTQQADNSGWPIRRQHAV